MTGAALDRYIPDLARLRMSVFRDFPYLYLGTEDYERQYLESYVRSPMSIVVLALDGDRAIGASTGLPLEHEPSYVTDPFTARGLDITTYFYFGESVLEKSYRGRGIGVRFFEEREKHARSFGRFATACFCAVERPATHPLRPANYAPLNEFWTHRGYRKDPTLVAQFEWRDLDRAEPTAKPMAFWFKRL
jgi:GNAT superfamily N-acetyltransferase